MKFKRIISLVLICGMIVVGSCKKKKDPTPEPEPQPTLKLSTSPVTSVTEGSAIGGGAIISEGTSAVVSQGICWDTLPEPSLTRGIVINSTGTNNYTCAVTGLKTYHKYFVRAFATNASETAYGSELSFMSSDVWSKLTVSTSTSTYIWNLEVKGNDIYAALNPSTLVYSPDGGDTWQSTSFTSSSSIGIIKIVDNGAVIVRTSNAIAKSTDKGKTWTTPTGLPQPLYLSAITNDGPEVYAASSGSILLSLNNGDTWSAKTISIQASPFTRLSKGASGIFALTSTTSSAVFKTDNKGDSWKQLTAIAGLNEIVCVGHNVFASSNDGTYFSSNDGETWSKRSDLESLWTCFAALDQLVFYASKNSQCKLSVDGGMNWTPLTSTGLPPATASNLIRCFITETVLFMWYGGGGGVYRLRR